MQRRFVLAAAMLTALALPAHADTGDGLPARDPARPAIGDWTGRVSWSEHPVTYAWAINADGSFTSGRLGRGHDGAGRWSLHGETLTLKYDSGFRYDGVLRGDGYAGTAYEADGDALGTFAMSRDEKRY